MKMTHLNRKHSFVSIYKILLASMRLFVRSYDICVRVFVEQGWSIKLYRKPRITKRFPRNAQQHTGTGQIGLGLGSIMQH